MKLGKNFAFQFNSEILKIFQERWFSIACYIMAFYKGVTRVCTFEDNGDVNPKIVYFACAIRNMRKQNILYKKKQHIQQIYQCCYHLFTIQIITIVIPLACIYYPRICQYKS